MDRWTKKPPADESPDESSTSSSSAGGRWTKKRPADKSSGESSSSSAGGYKNFRPRKKPAPRRSDPGRRYQRGRIYDSALGITCHFCRQKTTDKHVICCGRTCMLAFCGSCLHNRHGEDMNIETMDEDYSWLCPRCRGGCGPSCKNCCNCSFCRRKQNLQPPKIANSEMHAQGFNNVHDYLIHLETGESPETISARKVGKGWCRTHEKNVLKSHQNSKIHKKRKVNTKKSSDEVIKTQEFTSKLHEKGKKDANKGSDDVGSSVIHENSEKDTSKEEVVIKKSDAQDMPHKESFPLQFSSRNDFKEKLEAKRLESFSSKELSELWDAINCRRPVCKVIETPQGTVNFPTKELGSSYLMQHPDLARQLTATGNKEEELRILRGFFFWLERASMSGSFKPWLENEKDAECVELAGPDCQVLGVRINLDEHQHEKNQEDTKPNKITQDVKESLSPQAKIIFNWDAEDVKPTIKERWVKLGKFSSVDTQIHVKEEQDTS